MGKKDYIKQSEEKIERYFFIENKIKLLEITIEDLEKQTMKIEDSIKDLTFLETSKINIKSSGFESISNSNTPSSYIENGIIKQIEQKEILLENINTKIKDYKNEIEILKIENLQMKNIINMLSDSYKEMLILKYFKNKNENEIANKLNLSISQYHRNKNKILKDIHNLMIMYKEI